MEKKPLFDKTHLLRAVVVAVILFVAGFLLEMHRPLMTRLSDAFMLSGAVLIIIGMYSVLKNMSGPSVASVMHKKMKPKPAVAVTGKEREEAEAAEGSEAQELEMAESVATEPEGPEPEKPAELTPPRVRREALLIGVIMAAFSAFFAFVLC